MRLALGLALAERALASFESPEEMGEPLRAALEKSWSRLETGAPAPEAIYRHMPSVIDAAAPRSGVLTHGGSACSARQRVGTRLGTLGFLTR